jgi:ribose-phosphate pyrophosphokinase
VPAEKLNHKIRVLTVAPMLAEAIMRIHKDLSISAMFV